MEDEQFWAATLEALSTVEQVLAKMMETVSGNSGENSSQSALKSLVLDDDGGGGHVDKTAAHSGHDFGTGSNNIRVKVRKWFDSLDVDRSLPFSLQATSSREIYHICFYIIFIFFLIIQSRRISRDDLGRKEEEQEKPFFTTGERVVHAFFSYDISV